jgi:hypothetical protein
LAVTGDLRFRTNKNHFAGTGRKKARHAFGRMYAEAWRIYLKDKC